MEHKDSMYLLHISDKTGCYGRKDYAARKYKLFSLRLLEKLK